MGMSLDVRVDLDPAQQTQLEQIFATEGTDELRETLQLIAAAAIHEYVLAFTGEPAPATLRGVRELRLALLYRHLGKGGGDAGGDGQPATSPTDRQVAQLFQLTPAQAATLIAGSRARYPADFETRLRADGRHALLSGSGVENERRLHVLRIEAPDSLARYLKDLVARTIAPPLEKRRDASQMYDLLPDTVEELAGQLGIREPRRAIPQLRWPPPS